ncbi:MAG TPA: hypothetical protein VKM72_09010 [Thermoanaerobaculia bacterium]|nr:hypothetical protein [Thermoanaerobaculia bacterium]
MAVKNKNFSLEADILRLGGGGRQSLSFEEIAALQGVGPIEDPNELAGGWPGEIDDGFEEAVLAWRRGERWPKE